MLDNYQNYPTLTTLLPTLGDLFHDKAEKVRLAFVKLLVKVKHIRAFKVWSGLVVVHIETWVNAKYCFVIMFVKIPNKM